MQSEMANLGGQIDTSAADSLRLVSELKGHEEDLAPRWHGSAMKPQRDPRPTTSRGLQPDFAGCGRSPAKEAAGKLRGRSEGDGGGERLCSVCFGAIQGLTCLTGVAHWRERCLAHSEEQSFLPLNLRTLTGTCLAVAFVCEPICDCPSGIGCQAGCIGACEEAPAEAFEPLEARCR